MNDIKLNINSNDSHTPDFLYVWGIIKKRPSKAFLHHNIDDGILGKILMDNFPNKELESISSDIVPLQDELIENVKYFEKLDDGVWITYVSVDGYEKRFDSDIQIIYDVKHNEVVSDLIDKISKHSIFEDGPTSINRENLLCIKEGSLETEPMLTHTDCENIDLFYTKKVYTKMKKLVKSLSDEDRGISILCGIRGTGKTNCLKYISAKTDELTIYIPNNLLDHSINNPEFKNLISGYTKVILFVDDCEFVTNSQFSNPAFFTSNVIQMTDGMVDTNIHIVLTFNEHIDKIDQNILDSNHVRNVIEFGKLSIDECTELRTHLGIKKKVEGEMILRDVINIGTHKKTHIGL